MKSKFITLGILGGGQLGRMSALAASNLGIRTHIFCPEDDPPAAHVTPYITRATYEDESALSTFAQSVDFISYEFENIPLKTIDFLEKLKPVFPGANLLEISQNRLKEKDFLNKAGIPTTRWAPAYSAEDIEGTLNLWGADQCIVKTTRFGYDGKGQLKIQDREHILSSWIKINAQELIIEDIVDYTHEISCIVARDAFGTISTFPITENEHHNHILARSHAPARCLTEMQTAKAVEMTIRLAEAIDLRGILALEMFLTRDGALLANEIAPRPHNSGHWTMDGCTVSQFEQHVRAVCGLPLRVPRQHSRVEMQNLIGDDIFKLPEYEAMDNAAIHLYGKEEARTGRKMGHVNLVYPL